MPPFGLYPVPRHHLYGGRTKPKTYNTNEFSDDAASAAAKDPALPARSSELSESRSPAKLQETKARNTNKEKGRLLSADKNAELERLLDRAEANWDKRGLSKKEKKRKKQKKQEEKEGRKKHQQSNEDTQSTPDTSSPAGGQTVDHGDAGQQKKRKRESEVHAAATSTRSVNEEYLAGQQLDSLFRFGSSPLKPLLQRAQVVAPPSRKKTKSKKTVQCQDSHLDATTSGHTSQSKIVDLPSTSESRRNSHVSSPDPAKPVTRKSLGKTPLSRHRVPINGIEKVEAKGRGDGKVTNSVASDPVTPSLVAEQHRKRTPIPFPRLRQASSAKSTGTNVHQDGEKELPISQVLVPETPPSMGSKRTPVTVAQDKEGKSDTMFTKYKFQEDHGQFALVSSPTPYGDASKLSTALVALASSQDTPKLPPVPHALTDANLRSFKRPATDVSKLRPRTKMVPSTTTTIPTSSASMSISEAFARVGKSHTRMAVDTNPLVVDRGNLKTPNESQEADPLDVFTQRYHDVTKTVNFDDEYQYLEEYMEWEGTRKHDAVPCLHQITGCSAKKEELLRMSKEENMEILGQLDTLAEDVAKLDEARNQAQRAEDLLMLATHAGVPVPVGCIEGTWTLYCPKYAATHFDRYGYGQRTLMIKSIAGFRHRSTFTARMQLPPRTMAFSILAFEIPPHASFRTTAITTASEGYTMEVVFLGNGFLHLRADLGRLLTGTTRKPNEGAHVMEFIGVHEEATQWWREKKGETGRGIEPRSGGDGTM